MIASTPSAVDAYIEQALVREDAVMRDVLAANAAAGLPHIDVSAAQGKYLELLVRMTGARRILEIGTLGGYSTIWMARALPAGGEVVTLEFDRHHADTAEANFERAGVSDRVRLIRGAAADTLPVLAGEAPVPFDLVFIDADKPSNPIYLDWAIRLGRPGTVIVLDNVVRDGKVVDAQSTDANVQGVRKAFDIIAASPRLSATALQTVGSKGWDGFAVMILS